MLKLLNGWIVIRDLEPDEKSIGSIFIPDGSVESAHKWAEVLEVGKGESISSAPGWSKVDLEKGDKVLYVRFLKKTHTGISLIPVLEREYGAGSFLIRESDVICVEPKEK